MPDMTHLPAQKWEGSVLQLSADQGSSYSDWHLFGLSDRYQISWRGMSL